MAHLASQLTSQQFLSCNSAFQFAFCVTLHFSNDMP